MKTLVVYDPTNTILGFFLPSGSRAFKRDGNEFALQAKRYTAYLRGVGDTVEMVELPKGASHLDKRQYLIRFLRGCAIEGKIFDNFTFFGHGHKKALNRKMVTEINIQAVASALRCVLTGYGKITLFACNTAKDPSPAGFARRFAYLTGTGVVGHTGRGHTTRFPWKRWASPHNFTLDLWPSYRGGKRSLKTLLNSYPDAPFEYVDVRCATLTEKGEA